MALTLPAQGLDGTGGSGGGGTAAAGGAASVTTAGNNGTAGSGGGGGGGGSGLNGGAGGAATSLGGIGATGATQTGSTVTGNTGGIGTSGGSGGAGGGGGGGAHAYVGALSGVTADNYYGGAGGAGGGASPGSGGGGGGGGYGMVITGLNDTTGSVGAVVIAGGAGGAGGGGTAPGAGGSGGAGLFIDSSTGTNVLTVNATVAGGEGGSGGAASRRTGSGGTGLYVQRSDESLTVNVGGAVTGGAGGAAYGNALGGIGGNGITLNGTGTPITLNISANVTGGAGGYGFLGGGDGAHAIGGSYANIVVDGTAGPVAITGGNAGMPSSGAGGVGIFGAFLSVTLRGDVTVASGQGTGPTWDMILGGSSTLTLEADASGHSPTLTTVQAGANAQLFLAGSNNGTTSADLTAQFGSVTKTGSSTWTLTSGSSVSGVTAWNLNEGRLAVGSSDVFVSGSTIRFAGGTLNATATMSAASAVSLADGTGEFLVDDGRTLTVSGAVSGNNVLTKSGTGELSLTNANTAFTGGVVVSAGTLSLSGSGGLAAASGVTLGANATLDISATTAGTSLKLSSSEATSQVLLGARTLTVDGTGTFAGTISGTGGLTKTGSGTLTLTGDNGYTGVTTISTGTLQIGNGGTTGSIAGDVVNNASLIFNRSDAYTITGAITGTGVVTFMGGGTVSFSDTATFSAPITVDGSNLKLLDGSQIGSTVIVETGGTISGNGEIGGLSVNAGGTAAPGNSPGTLTVSGTVTFLTGSVYRVDVTPAGDHDLILATGAVTLSGGTVEVVAVPGAYAANTRYAIITTTSSVTGNFASVTSDYAFLTPSLSYDAQNVYLTLVYASSSAAQFSAFAQTQNQFATATAAQTLGQGNAVFDALLQQTTSSAPGAFNALSGEAYASVGTVIQQQAVYVREAVVSRLMQSLTAPGVSPLAYGAGPQTAALGEGLTPTLWAQGYGGWGNSFSNGNAASISNNIGGFLLGLDVALAPNVRAGVFGGFSQSQFDVTDRSSTGSMNNVDLGVYAGAQFGAFSLRGGAAYTWHDVSMNRTVAFPGFSQAVEGGYNTGTTQVFGEVGYDFAVGAYAFEPFAGLAYVNVAGASLQEGGGSAGLSVSTSGMSTTYSTLGLRVATTMQVWGSTLTPHAMVGWQHAFGDTTPTSTMQFLGGTTPFSVSGVPIAEDAVLLQAGLTYALSPKATLGASYTSQLARTAAQNAFTAQFSLKF